MDRTVWQGGCRSWCKTADGHVTNSWPSSPLSFWWWLRKLCLREMSLHPLQSGD
ncbi:MAG: hypothetical protein ISN29_08910 [Gammaproteobacteria bacterium AqS3]|nr:hypothetical protein [Gammaproteobacteria bacterium AqS3]